VPSVERFTVAVSGQETKFRTGTVPVNLPSINRN
jgi:hypothetical protein